MTKPPWQDTQDLQRVDALRVSPTRKTSETNLGATAKAPAYLGNLRVMTARRGENGGNGCGSLSRVPTIGAKSAAAARHRDPGDRSPSARTQGSANDYRMRDDANHPTSLPAFTLSPGESPVQGSAGGRGAASEARFR